MTFEDNDHPAAACALRCEKLSSGGISFRKPKCVAFLSNPGMKNCWLFTETQIPFGDKKTAGSKNAYEVCEPGPMGTRMSYKLAIEVGGAGCFCHYGLGCGQLAPPNRSRSRP